MANPNFGVAIHQQSNGAIRRRIAMSYGVCRHSRRLDQSQASKLSHTENQHAVREGFKKKLEFSILGLTPDRKVEEKKILPFLRQYVH